MIVSLRISLTCLLVLTACSQMADSIFLLTPRRLIWNIIDSLGAQHQPKEMKPAHHYHMHYYPVPIRLPPPPKVEIELSGLHGSHHHHHESPVISWPSKSWDSFPSTDYALPSPLSSPSWDSTFADSWHDVYQQKSSPWDNNEIAEKDHSYKESEAKGIYLQVPLKQQIVFVQPAKEKTSLLTTIVKKLRRVSNALFHTEEEEDSKNRDPQPHITNSLSYTP